MSDCEEVDVEENITIISDDDDKSTDDEHQSSFEYKNSLRKTLLSQIFLSPQNSNETTTESNSSVSPQDKVKIEGLEILLPINPYRSQINIMSQVIRAIKKKTNCLVESPTGTGKTLALLCSTLAWQKKEKEDIAKLVSDSHPNLIEAVSIVSESKHVTEHLFTKKTFGEKSIYDNTAQQSRFSNQQAGPSSGTRDDVYIENNLVTIHKSRKTTYPTSPEKPSQPESSSQTLQKDTETSIFDETLETTKKMFISSRCPVIYYGVRTHSQLQQVVAELKRTSYKNGIKMTILSSRGQSCIRLFDVKQWQSRENMCKSCTKPISSPEGDRKDNKTNCQYFDKRKLFDRHHLPPVFDIKKLKKVGKRLGACPYYAARSFKSTSDIIFCPYNFILDPKIRNSLKIDLTNNILIIDEGHNIEDVCREMATYSFTTEDIKAVLKELNHAKSTLLDNDTRSCIDYLIKALEEWQQWFHKQLSRFKGRPISECRSFVAYNWDIEDFVNALPPHVGRDRYQELSKNVTQLINKIRNSSETVKHLTIATENLLESLNSAFDYIFGGHMDSYKPVLELHFKDWSSWEKSSYDNVANHKCVSLTLYCMSPAVTFSQLATARSVVLASGTLSPIISLQSELDSEFGTKAIEKHIISHERVWVGALCGQRCAAQELRQARARQALGGALRALAAATPHGVLCFLPSYSALDGLLAQLKECKMYDEIQKYKKIFKEANNTKDHEETMKAYNAAARDGGALLLAVYRGKAAEGVDFSDERARAVVLVGIPYPARNKAAVAHKIEYNDRRRKSNTKLLSGNEWYEVQAYRALNQALGRCVRHAGDWGAVLLLDQRYSQPRYTQLLSPWAKALLGNRYYNDLDSLMNKPNGIKVFMDRMQQN